VAGHVLHDTRGLRHPAVVFAERDDAAGLQASAGLRQAGVTEP
jgi:hypothetical protein